MFWEFSLVNQTTKNQIKIIQQTENHQGYIHSKNYQKQFIQWKNVYERITKTEKHSNFQ